MGCECPDTSYAAGTGDYNMKYELGPAYEDVSAWAVGRGGAGRGRPLALRGSKRRGI